MRFLSPTLSDFRLISGLKTMCNFAWSQFNIPRYFTNSLVVSTISTLLIIILSLMFSFAISRLRWRFREGVRLYMTIGMFMPLQVIMIPLAILVRDLHLTNTYGGLIVPYVAIGLPFSCLVFYGFMKGILGSWRNPLVWTARMYTGCFCRLLCRL